MAFADTAARRLLRGAGGGVAKGIAADAVGMSFGLDGLWQLIAGLFAGVVHLLVLPFEVLGHWLQEAIAAVAHLVVLPFEALWHLLQSAAAGVSFCLDSLFVTLGSAAHALVVPFQALWHLLQSAAAGVSLCFSNLVSALGSVPHALAVPFEALWHLLQSAAAGVSLCFSNLVPALEAFWRWVKDAAPVALPYVLAIAAVVCVAALVWYGSRFLCTAAELVARALVRVLCSCWQALCNAGVQVAPALGRVLRFCWDCLIAVAMWVVLCCTRVTMVGPGAAGALISRPAFAANPRLYFKILRLAGPVVAAAVFSSSPVAWVVGAAVGVLFSL